MKFVLTSDTHYGFSQRTHRIHDKFWAEIAALNCPVIWAGDLASNKLDQFERTLLHARKYVANPIYMVKGNHDFWQTGRHNWKEWPLLLEAHANALAQANVHYLQGDPVVIFGADEVVTLYGFDGWYGAVNPPTNDHLHLPHDYEGVPVHTYLNSVAHKEVERILSSALVRLKRVVVTHFPPFTEAEQYRPLCASASYMQPLCEFADVLCVGHSHRRCDFYEGRCRVLNAGSDYDKPQYLVFEV